MINYFADECLKQYIRDDIEEFLSTHNIKTPLDYVLQKFTVKECIWQDIQNINSVRRSLAHFQNSCTNKKYLPFEEGDWTFFEILQDETSLLYYADDLPANNVIIFCYERKTSYFGTNSQLLTFELEVHPCAQAQGCVCPLDMAWESYIEKCISTAWRAELAHKVL